jgi:hypothetical protein
MVTARLIVDGGVLRAHVPYALKHIVKALPERRWENELKVWVVPTSYTDGLADALRVAGATVYVQCPDGSPWTGGGDSHGFRDTPRLGWADALMAAVGHDRHELVYRALAKTLHPDTSTGDHRLMQQLNAARERARSLPKPERPW